VILCFTADILCKAFKIELAGKIVELRTKAGLTQEELAKKITSAWIMHSEIVNQFTHKSLAFFWTSWSRWASRDKDIKSWCDTWGIDADAMDLRYDVKENRVVFPIKDKGRIVDATGRSMYRRLPKWKRYGASDLPFSFGCGNIAVVVEDCVSAGVVGSDVLVGVAVLGTSLSDSHKLFLSQFSTAIIALDPDALPKSFACLAST